MRHSRSLPERAAAHFALVIAVQIGERFEVGEGGG
jgi:hypothetical protein